LGFKNLYFQRNFYHGKITLSHTKATLTLKSHDRRREKSAKEWEACDFNREKSVGKAREIPWWGLFPAKNGMKSPFEKSPP